MPIRVYKHMVPPKAIVKENNTPAEEKAEAPHCSGRMFAHADLSLGRPMLA